jgi:hypothetical protein
MHPSRATRNRLSTTARSSTPAPPGRTPPPIEQTQYHVLVSSCFLSVKSGFDVVHVNAEFLDQASDHDPSVVRFSFGAPTGPSARTRY